VSEAWPRALGRCQWSRRCSRPMSKDSKLEHQTGLAAAGMAARLHLRDSSTTPSNTPVSEHAVREAVCHCACRKNETCASEKPRTRVVGACSIKSKTSYVIWPSCRRQPARPTFLHRGSGPGFCHMCVQAASDERDGPMLTGTEPQAPAPPGHHHPQPHARLDALAIARQDD
jgi:hypothetical protein